MNRRTFAGSVAAALATTSLLLPSSPARAAATCEEWDDATNPIIHSVSVGDVVTNAGGRTAAAVTVRASDPVALELCYDEEFNEVPTEYASGLYSLDVDMEAVGTNGGTFAYVSDLSLVSGSIYDGTFRGYVYFDKYDATGLWYVHASAMDNGINIIEASNADTFRVRRNTTLTLNASPEPVRRYSYLTLAGKARYLDPYSGYLPYRNKEVRLYFKAVGSATWVYKGSAWTDRYGEYTKRIKATRDGTWRAHHSGSGGLAARNSAGDYVDTR